MKRFTDEILALNRSTAMWKGRELRFLTRQELYEALEELGNLYKQLVEKEKYDQ